MLFVFARFLRKIEMRGLTSSYYLYFPSYLGYNMTKKDNVCCFSKELLCKGMRDKTSNKNCSFLLLTSTTLASHLYFCLKHFAVFDVEPRKHRAGVQLGCPITYRLRSAYCKTDAENPLEKIQHQNLNGKS